MPHRRPRAHLISRHAVRGATNVPRVDFRNDPDHHRYVLEEAGEVVAFTEYEDRDDRLFFPHTEVDDAHEGRGLASQLVRQALDDVRTLDRRIVPLCSYVRVWIERHPGYDDLVDHELTNRYLSQMGA